MAHRLALRRRGTGRSPGGRASAAVQSMAASCSLGSRSHTTRPSVSSASTGASRGLHHVDRRPSPSRRRGHLEPVRRDRIGGRHQAPRGPTRCAAARRRAGGPPPAAWPTRAPGRAPRCSAPWRAACPPGAAWRPPPWRRGAPRGDADRAAGRPSARPPRPGRRLRRPSPPTAARGSPVGGGPRGVPTMTPMARFTMPETLPEGEEKVEAVRSMFDAIAPALRPGEPDHDVPHGRRLAPQDGAQPRPAAGLDGARPRVRHRRPVPRAGAERAPPDRRRPVVRDAGRRPHRRAARARRRPAPARCPTARSTASPAASPCATSRACRRSSPSWPGWCGRAGAIALLEVAEPPNRLLRAGHGVYFGKVVPLIGGLLSDPAAYRYLPAVGRLPARARRDARPAGRPPGSSTSTGASCPSASPSSSPATRSADRVTDARRHAPGASTRTSTCSPSPGATACCSSAAARGLAGRGVAAARARWPTADARARRHRGRRRGRRPRHRAGGASAPSPTGRTRRTELVVPEVVWGRADDGTRWVTTITAAGRRPTRRRRRGRPMPLPPAVVGDRAARPPGGVVVRAGRACHQGDARRAGRAACSKVVLAREVLRRGRRALRPGRRPRAPAARLPGLLPLPRRRLRRRQPRAAR